jgi:hypothetical protein
MNLMAEWETGSGMTEGSTWALENVDMDMGVHITRGKARARRKQNQLRRWEWHSVVPT